MTSAMPMPLHARLYDDRRGAVMLTGLIMSCFLIGALWYIIGMGDAFVFREQMQEAADHGAFTAAALNAKGMNFIALCNLIMFAATVIYIILGVLTDVFGAIHAVCMTVFFEECGDDCLLNCLTDGFLGSCPTFDAWNAVFNVWNGYYQVYEKGLKVMHGLEVVAADVYPVIGAAEAYGVGNQYQTDNVRHGPVNIIALSGGMMPAPKKSGLLPVQEKPYNDLCNKVVSVTTNGIINSLGLGSKLPGSSFLGAALGQFDDIIGAVLKARYCNDSGLGPFFYQHDPHQCFLPWPISGGGPGTKNDFWSDDSKGFYVVYTGAQNGNMYMQTWALNVNPTLKDRSESKVLMAATKPLQATKYDKTETAFYLAQSEMYFDCESQWSTPDCNAKDNALFAIKWRARLVKLDAPQILSGALNTAMSLAADKILTQVGSGSGLSGLVGALGGGVISQAVINTIATVFSKELNNWATGPSGIGQFDPSFKGVYH